MDTTKPQAWVYATHVFPDLSIEIGHNPTLGEMVDGMVPGDVLLLESGRWSVLSASEFARLYEWDE
jgi:hypothetical protein